VIEIRKLIQTLGKEKLVLLSTHILQEVEAVADQVVILNRGSVVLNEAVEALKKDDEQVVAVSFDYRVESVALQKIPFVKTVVNTSNFDYELTFDQDKDMRPAVFDFAHDNGLKILSLQQKIKGLEKRFNSLTQRD
jgi:ABC-2 type transport system ATP-binding protein